MKLHRLSEQVGCSLALGVSRLGLCVWVLIWFAVLSAGCLFMGCAVRNTALVSCGDTCLFDLVLRACTTEQRPLLNTLRCFRRVPRSSTHARFRVCAGSWMAVAGVAGQPFFTYSDLMGLQWCMPSSCQWRIYMHACTSCFAHGHGSPGYPRTQTVLLVMV